jgi:riboflavin synthase
MFSGIIQAIGKINTIEPIKGGGARLNIGVSRFPSISVGDSIAIDGVCFTVTSFDRNRLRVDVSPETLKKSNFGKRTTGETVNLELPVSPQSLLSGHLVQGHVDGCGIVRSWKREGADVRLSVELPVDLMQYCVSKGSISVNGVSLTIANLRKRVIEIALIPYTLEHTNLGQLHVGDPVNIEVDLIGKYVVSTLKKTYDRARLHRGRRPRNPRQGYTNSSIKKHVR